MIEAFRDFFWAIYENTGQEMLRVDVDRRVYDSLMDELDRKGMIGPGYVYPAYILLDGVLVYART